MRLGKWGRGEGKVGRDVQQVEEGGEEPGQVQAAHQVVHTEENSQPRLSSGRRCVVGCNLKSHDIAKLCISRLLDFTFSLEL